MTGTVARKFHIGKEIRKGYLASVYNYRPRNEEILARKGEVFAVLRLRTDPDFDLLTAGGILLDYFHETYFEMRESSTLLALEKTVISSGKHLAKLIEKEDKVSKTGIEMDLMAAAIVENNAFFVNVGSSKLYIYRDGNQVDLGPALKDPTGEGLVEVASMTLEKNDRLLMTTEAASSLMSDAQIEKILKSFDLDEFPQKAKSDHEHALMLIGYSLAGKKEEALAAVGGRMSVEELDTEGNREDSLENEDLLESENEALEAQAEQQADLDAQVGSAEMDVDVGERESETDGAGVEVEPSEFGEDVETDLGETIDTDKHRSERDEKFEDEFDQDSAGDFKSQKTYQVLLANTKESIKAFPAKLSSKISAKMSKGPGEEGAENAERTEGKKISRIGSRIQTTPQKKYLILGVAIVICTGALYLGVRQAIKNNEEKIQTEEVQVSLDVLKEKVELLEELVAEIKLADSTEKRQQGLSEVELAKAEIEKVKDFDNVKEEVEQYRQRVATAEDYFNRIITVGSDDEFLDVASFFPDAKISDIAFSASKLYLSDEGLGKIYSVGYEGTDIEEVASGLTSPTSLTVDNNGKVIFLDGAEENRIGVYDPETGNTRRLAGTSQSRIGDVADIEYVQIGGGRLYLVDRTNTRVMYMERSGENYGLPASRFTLSELATGKDVYIIDNKIYVLAGFKQGLYRFFNGQDDSPELIGLPEGQNMLSATGMFVDGINIYFTDPVGGRIAIFDKGIQTAKFKGQFKSKDSNIFSGIKDLVVVSSQGKIYTIDQSVVYELDLSKLNEL